MNCNFSIRRFAGNRIIILSDEMAAIEVIQRHNQRHHFLFDRTQENLSLVAQYRWFVHEKYPCTIDELGKYLYLPWLLYGRPQRGYVWHHIRDRLDNRSISLRYITTSLNNFAKNTRKNNSTGIRGISRYKNGGYSVLVGLNCKRKWFRRLEDAIEARQKFEREMEELIMNSPIPVNGHNGRNNGWISPKINKAA